MEQHLRKFQYPPSLHSRKFSLIMIALPSLTTFEPSPSPHRIDFLFLGASTLFETTIPPQYTLTSPYPAGVTTLLIQQVTHSTHRRNTACSPEIPISFRKSLLSSIFSLSIIINQLFGKPGRDHKIIAVYQGDPSLLGLSTTLDPRPPE